MMALWYTHAKEPSKMATDEKHPTKEELAAQIQRIRARGWNPLQAILQHYAQQGRAIVKGVLDALESDDSPKKKD